MAQPTYLTQGVDAREGRVYVSVGGGHAHVYRVAYVEVRAVAAACVLERENGQEALDWVAQRAPLTSQTRHSKLWESYASWSAGVLCTLVHNHAYHEVLRLRNVALYAALHPELAAGGLLKRARASADDPLALLPHSTANAHHRLRVLRQRQHALPGQH
eukprot:scaffold1183_cov418-Prasinococcus_capsulatus_cf.AAC.12